MKISTLCFRRFFIVLLILTGAIIQSNGQKTPEIGIVHNMENDSLLYASGYRYLVESVAKCFSPITLTDQQFQQKLIEMKKLKTNLFAVNLFIPGEFKLVGPDVNEKVLLEYTETVLARCEQAGVRIVTWGSGGARRVPPNVDPVDAWKQFAMIALKIAIQAKRHNIILALENLNSTETNFITKLDDAYRMVVFVNHPNLRLCVDIYHMLKEEETPDIIEKAGALVVHCDIAEKDGRTAPGVNGDDFTGYLKALKNINYTGKIMLECRWKNFATQGAEAHRYLQLQIDQIYRKK